MATDLIRIHSFKSLAPGRHLVIFGAIHGNEPCGPEALARLIADFDSGKLALQAGSVTIVPVCNPEAFRQKKRYIDENLNRILDRIQNPQSYEAKLSNQLAPLLETCDALLDLHSQRSKPPEPFVFGAPFSPDAKAFEEAIGCPTIISGFADAYALTPEAAGKYTNVLGTTGYARQFKALANTIECGQNGDPAAVEIAYKACLNALGHLGLIQHAPQPLTPSPQQRFALKRVWFKDADETPAGQWQHLQKVAAGTILSRNAAGNPVAVAPGDGYLIFPDLACPTGEEWLYWAEKN